MASGTLQISGLTKSFDGIKALDLADTMIEFLPGCINALLGGNGAGKTTLFNVLSGILLPDSGQLVWRGTKLNSLSVWYRWRLGISRLWQDLRLFQGLTALENIQVALPCQRGEQILTALFRCASISADEAKCEETAMRVLQALGLIRQAHSFPKELSYGQQKLLALGRVLANPGDLVLLDEPMAGLAHEVCLKVANLIEGLRNEGRTVIVIEHDLIAIRKLVDHVVVLDRGNFLASGSLSEVLGRPDVRSRYAGIR